MGSLRGAGRKGQHLRQHAHLKVQEQPITVLEVASLSGTMKELSQHPWYWGACWCQRWAGALTSRVLCSYMCNVAQWPWHSRVYGARPWSRGRCCTKCCDRGAVQHFAASGAGMFCPLGQEVSRLFAYGCSADCMGYSRRRSTGPKLPDGDSCLGHHTFVKE